MTTYNLNTTASQARYLPWGSWNVFANIPLTTATSGDVYNLPITIPAGAYVTDAYLDCDKIDSNGSPAVVLALGDATSTGRYITGATVGQTANAGYAVYNTKGSLGYQCPSNTTLQLQVTTSAATFAAGNARVMVQVSSDVKQAGG